MGVRAAYGPDFHVFLRQAAFAMWISLETRVPFVWLALFPTRSTDPRLPSSQLVDTATLVFIAVSTISAACTGIDCYYCIYIDISIDILRRSKRARTGSLHINKRGGRLVPGLVERSEVRALHGADAAHVMQAGAHAVGDAVTKCFLARGGAGIFFFA
jgi:hypothetical protein